MAEGYRVTPHVICSPGLYKRPTSRLRPQPGICGSQLLCGRPGLGNSGGADAGGAQGDGCPHEGPISFSLFWGSDPSMRFSSAFYKKCVTTDKEQYKSNSLTRKIKYLPYYLCTIWFKRTADPAIRHFLILCLIPHITTRGRQVLHKSTTDLLMGPHWA